MYSVHHLAFFLAGVLEFSFLSYEGRLCCVLCV